MCKPDCVLLCCSSVAVCPLHAIRLLPWTARDSHAAAQDDKAASNGSAPARPQPRGPPAGSAPKKDAKVDDYLGDMDLPSSSSSEDEGAERYSPLYAAEEKERDLGNMVRGVLRCHGLRLLYLRRVVFVQRGACLWRRGACLGSMMTRLCTT